MSLSQIRRRIDTLMRKFAPEITVIRLRPLAEEFCGQWAAADPNRLPETHPLIQRIVAQGFRFKTFMQLRRYLDRRRDANAPPDCRGVLAALLPHTVANGLLRRILQWDDTLPTFEPPPLPLVQSLGVLLQTLPKHERN